MHPSANSANGFGGGLKIIENFVFCLKLICLFFYNYDRRLLSAKTAASRMKSIHHYNHFSMFEHRRRRLTFRFLCKE